MANKVIFKSPYVNRPSKAIHEKCPIDKVDYILDKSTGHLRECGKIPFYERIQSHEQSTLLSFKLAQYGLGDTSALGSPGGNYGDFIGAPKSIQEILQFQDNSERNFFNLPEPIRNIFNNDFKEFKQSVTDGTVERRISDFINSFSSGGEGGKEGTGGEGGSSS